MSLARAHFERTLAARQAGSGTAEAPLPGAASLADRMLALLRMHQVQLKTIQSRTAKIAAKRDWIDQYAPYVEGVLAAAAGAQDEVVVTMMVWRLDIEDWPRALEIAAYALRHELVMPERFSRDVATTVLEEIADAALARPTPDPALAAPLDAALELVADHDMPDEVRAKAHRALGLITADADPVRAIDHLETALGLDPKAGVKTVLTRLRKQTASGGDDPPA